MNIYVGNLPHDIRGRDLTPCFQKYGRVESVLVIINEKRSRAFGFVEMPHRAEGRAAIDGLNGEQLKRRVLSVTEACS